MNKYSSIIPRLCQPLPWRGEWAITLGQKTYFSCSIDRVSERWHKHEDEHKRQWKEDGLRFIFWYVRDLIFKGYLDNPYEIDSRKVENN